MTLSLPRATALLLLLALGACGNGGFQPADLPQPGRSPGGNSQA